MSEQPSASWLTPFLILIILFLGIGGVFGLEYLRPEKDNLAVDMAIFGFLTSAGTWIKVNESHTLINSRMTDLVAKTDSSARAEEQVKAGIIAAQVLKESEQKKHP
jgi:ABC-type transport system involved in multi-copper enzyme maturation permease subunit